MTDNEVKHTIFGACLPFNVFAATGCGSFSVVNTARYTMPNSPIACTQYERNYAITACD